MSGACQDVEIDGGRVERERAGRRRAEIHEIGGLPSFVSCAVIVV